MKKLILPFVILVVVIVGVGIFFRKSGTMPQIQNQSDNVQKASVTINDKTVTVDLAKTQEEREKGLSGRTSLEANSGLLFIFEAADKPQTFWMKGMLMPIDIIWIKDGKIIRIDKNVPAPAEKTPDAKLKTYSSGQIVDYVLEVNSGFSDTNSFKTGDSVTFSGL